MLACGTHRSGGETPVELLAQARLGPGPPSRRFHPMTLSARVSVQRRRLAPTYHRPLFGRIPIAQSRAGPRASGEKDREVSKSARVSTGGLTGTRLREDGM
jgi:hypothetical protein